MKQLSIVAPGVKGKAGVSFTKQLTVKVGGLRATQCHADG